MANLIASLILIVALCVISRLFYQTKTALTASLHDAHVDNEKLKKIIVGFQKKYANNIEAEEGVVALQKEQAYINDKNKELKHNYSENKKIYDALRRDIAIYSEQLDLIHDGFYEPHFDFASSELYKAKILETHEKQKVMIKAKSAVICNTEWTIGGSRSEGKKMTNKQIRLSLRAFNNECDASIASTTWRNANKMEQRIKKSFEDINKLNEEQQVFITSEYLNLKL